jgi:hypothetical protein
MSNYCFAEPEGRQALFAEACARGWVAAICDFPQRKSREECTAPALIECDVLRPEVCCITDESAYQQLVSSAWVGGYAGQQDTTEREAVQMAYAVKVTSRENVLAIVRYSFTIGEAHEEIDKAYQEFLEAIRRK